MNIYVLYAYSSPQLKEFHDGKKKCQDQLDALIAQIRTEKYFEAHGIRTPLPARQVPVKEEAEFEFVDDEMAPRFK